MRLLFLIHAYPLDVIGGHEIRCQRTVEGLRQRGHDVLVLTTFKRGNGPRKEGHVWRLLRSKWSEDPKRSAFKWVFVYRHNVKVFNRVVKEFRPEIICRWGLNWCTAAFVNYVHEHAPCPIVTFVGGGVPGTPDDLWFHFCRTPAKGTLRNLVKRTLVRIAGLWIPTQPQELVYETVSFLSQFVKGWCLTEGGWKVNQSTVIYGAIDTNQFLSRTPNAYCHPPRFMFAARLSPEKDPLTCLRATEHLAQKGLPVQLTMVGGTDIDLIQSYSRAVTNFARSLNGIVDLRLHVPPQEMPMLLHQHDAFIFISRMEGLGQALLEAMACGLAVIATRCGGPDEILMDGENCLIFPFGDADALAEQMERLIHDPALVVKLGQNAQRLVRERFTLKRYLDETEELLRSVIRKA